MNLSHSASGSEIPDTFETEKDLTRVVLNNPSNTERVITCLSEAGGESLSVEEITEETGLPDSLVRKILRKLSAVSHESREVFEDENEEDSYFLTAPLLDRLSIGA